MAIPPQFRQGQPREIAEPGAEVAELVAVKAVWVDEWVHSWRAELAGKVEPGLGQYATCASELAAASAVGCCLTLPELRACSSDLQDSQEPAWDFAGEATEGLVSGVPSHRF